MLQILVVQSAKIVLSLEISIFLFTFFNKYLEVSRLFFNFALNSVSPFVWVSGLFTGKGRLRNVILESSNLANLNPSHKIRQRERPRRVYYILTYSSMLSFRR